MNTRLDADESAAFLARKLRAREPFFFLRYGDGAMECMRTHDGRTCDGEEYSPRLALDLHWAWKRAMDGENVYVGDWLSATFKGSTKADTRYEEWYRDLIGDARPKFLHFEALLLMRESEALVDFYRAVRDDPRRKLYMGPLANAGAAEMLGAEFLETPMQNLFAHVNELTGELLDRDFDVLLYGAGLAGNIPVVKCWETYFESIAPEKTYIHVGSALDPLFRGRTRQQQLRVDRARALFADLLKPKAVCA